MSLRTVIITGANSGIGKAAALRFAKAGHRVIMACRDPAKSRTAFDEISSYARPGQVQLMGVDMSSFASIRAFCEAFTGLNPGLDALIHNAAYFSHGEKYRLSPDGIELTFATNVAGPFLMTRLLQDSLKRSEDPRVLHAGSNIIRHFFSPDKEIVFDNLRGEANPKITHSVYRTYRDSKMALLMLTFRMAEAYRDAGISVNALQINGARMSKETLAKFALPWRMIAWVQNLFFPPASVMAEHYFQLCTSDRYRGVTGKFFNHKLEIMTPAGPKPGWRDLAGSGTYPSYAHRQDISEKIWALCTQWTLENTSH